MSKKFPILLIAVLLLAGMTAVTQQYIRWDEKSTQGDEPTAERLAYLDKKLQRKINKPKRYDKPKEAMEYYVEQRAPLGQTNIPVERYEIARRHMNDMPRIDSSQNLRLPSVNEANRPDALAAGANFSAWSSLGPGNVGGRTRTLAINPTTPSIMYTAGVAGGIWKTTDGGAGWSPLDDLMNNMAVTTIVIDPNDHNTLYAGTGEGFFNGDAVRGDGIFKSTDGGANWTHLAATSGNSNFHYVNKLAISSNNSSRVYAATRGGLFRSTDGGANWTQMHNGGSVPIGCLDIQIRTDNPDVLIASCGSAVTSTVYRSTDGGDSWASVLSESNMGRVSLAIAPSNQSTMYALAATHFNVSGNYGGGGLHAVFKSTDSGASWSATVRNTDGNKLNTALLSNPVYVFLADCGYGSSNQFFNQGWYDNIIAVDPANENIVWAGGIDLFRSDDGGANWGLASMWWASSNADEYVHADQHGIFFHPNYDGVTNKTAFFSHDGGLSRTLDARANTSTDACNLNGATMAYESLNNNYAVTQFYHGLAYPDGATFFGGTQDNGTIRGTTGGGMNWSSILGGDGGYVAIDPNNTNILFAETQNRGFRKSIDGGANFSSAVSGIGESTATFAFITPYVMDPNNAQILWIGGRTLWKTTNQANSWSQASTSNMLSNSASAWAVANGDSNYVAVGDGGGVVHYTTSAGSADSSTAWSSSTPTAGVVSSLTYDPNDKNILYATYSTFGVDHIWKSVNNGASWTAIDQRGSANGIPDIPVHSLAIDPDDSNRLFAGTDLGIFVSTDGGANWVVENVDFTNTVVENLHIIQSGGTSTLFAFTHGRGAWRTALASGSDTTPDAFSFVDQNDVALSTTITSNAITVSGIDAAAAISVTGGQYNIDGGAYTGTTGTVNNGNTVRVQHTSSSNFSTAVNTVLTIGGVSDTFTSTTLAASDTVPDAFNFVDQSDVALKTTFTSNTITVSGINAATSISLKGNGYFSVNGGAYTRDAATVNNGDTVNVRHRSSAYYATSVYTVLTIGGVSETFATTTLAEPDTVPDAFNFVDQTDVGLKTTFVSNTVTVSGINALVSVSLKGNGYFSVNGGAYTRDATTVKNGDVVNVRHRSSAYYATSVYTVLTIGGVSETFATTTLAEPDTVPNAFNFVDQTDVDLKTTFVSNTITVSGIDAAASISLKGNGFFSVNGGANTRDATTVNNGDTVNVSHRSSAYYATSVYTVLTIGGVSETFATTTLAEPDTVPDAFNFVDQTDVGLKTTFVSNTITVSGIDAATSISLKGNGYFSVNGGANTRSATTVINGDTVNVSHRSSAYYATSVYTVLTIGGVSETFMTTTEAASEALPNAPDAFSFVDQTDVALDTWFTSNAITVSGLNAPASISMGGTGLFNINGGAYRRSATTVSNGDTVTVRHESSAYHSTPTYGVLIIGGVSDTFTTTTVAESDTVPDAFSFVDQTDVALDTWFTSNAITVSGLNTPAPISMGGTGLFNINGGTYRRSATTVSNGDTVTVRHESSAYPSTPTHGVLIIGGVSDTFTTTTVAESDTVPDAFSFIDQTDVALNTSFTSNAITVSGLNAPASISMGGTGLFNINGGDYRRSATTVSNGDTVTVRHESSAYPSTSTHGVLIIGGVSDTFTTTTVAESDTTPDAFSLVDQTDVALSTWFTSNAITVSGLNAPAPISMGGTGLFNINGGAYGRSPTTVSNGDTVTVRHESSAYPATPTHGVLIIGGVSDTFTTTTAAQSMASSQ